MSTPAIVGPVARVARTAVVSLSNVQLSDFVRADAGNTEAQFGARLAALYTAYRAALQAGQKTPLLNLQAQCALYATPKACRALTDTPDKTSAQATRAARVYAAYKVALDTVGIPAKLKEGDVDALAATMAGEFASLVAAALAPAPVDAKAQAAAKAAREAAKVEQQAKADAEVQGKVDAAVRLTKASLEGAALTLADMVRIVANSVMQGMLDPDQLAELDHALDSQAVTVEYVATETAVPAELTA